MTNLPPDYVEEDTSLTIEQEDLITTAEEAGLTYSDIDDDGEVQFIGTKGQFTKFEELKKKYEIS